MITRPQLLSRAIALTIAGAMLAACGGDGSSQDRTGLLSLGITDAPVDEADAVVVQFTGVELKPKGGQAFSIDFAAPKTLDVLGLQGTERAMLLDGEQIDAGEYQWMRLKVQADPNVAGDSYITIGGAQCELRIPSGDETGLKLIRDFTIGVGTTTDFTIDFDLRKSVVQPPGQQTQLATCDGQAFLLKPVLRVVDNLEVGTITGAVSPTLIAESCPANESGNVYLFGPYTDTVPVLDDFDLNEPGDANDASETGPLTAAMVAGDGTYAIGFVPAGQYLAAYTCSADRADVDADDDDEPTGDDEAVLTFTPAAGTTLTVAAGETTTVDFEVEVPAT
ncbi:MAG: DUF4382 domain-containing protein [Steroidobacteraceae bacterium]